MKALHNFLISWVLMLCIAAAATLRFFIAPFTFIFIYDVYKKSTEDQVNYCHANLTKFVIGCSDYFKQYWRE
jgi:cell shape-determining protein MreC